MKRCNTCEISKSLDEFSPDKRAAMGRQSRCKACCALWARRNRETRPYYARAKKFGVSEEEIKKVMEHERCEICDRIDAKHIDHNHNDGSIRGLLCNDCNAALGLFKDSETILLKAIEYLQIKGSYG